MQILNKVVYNAANMTEKAPISHTQVFEEALTGMAKKLGVSKAEVMRRALSMHEALLKHQRMISDLRKADELHRGSGLGSSIHSEDDPRSV